MKYFDLLPDERKQIILAFCQEHRISLSAFYYYLLLSIDFDELSKLLEKD